MKFQLIYGVHAETALKRMKEESVDCVVTSPPYWGLRDYGHQDQIGMEKTPEAYVENLRLVFRKIHRVLKRSGTAWLNLGDTYANVDKWGGSTGGKHVALLHGGNGPGRAKREYGDLKPKDLVGIPWMVAFALRKDGWYLRGDNIWAKMNVMPESVEDRFTKAHEYVFLLTKSMRYFFDQDAVAEVGSENERARRLKEQAKGAKGTYRLRRDETPHGQVKPGRTGAARSVEARQLLALKGTRRRRTVWNISTVPSKTAGGRVPHLAVFPDELARVCIKAGCPIGGIVLDPFSGTATTGKVAVSYGRHFIGIDINRKYLPMAKRKILSTI